MVWKPSNGAIDPSTRDSRIRVGSTLGAGWSEDRNRDIDINEFVQFQVPGRYVLHAVLKHIGPIQITKENRHPWLNCVLQSNEESVEILPPDGRWEAAELVRIRRLLESGATRFRGATALRYLNTAEAAAELARSYLQLRGEPVNSELARGIFESQYDDIVQAKLEKALRSGVPFTENAVGTLALLDVRRQFVNRPVPSDPEAARAWSHDYWELFNSLKSKYSAAAVHAIR